MKINQKKLFLAEIANKRNIENERFENADKTRANLKMQNERLLKSNLDKENEKKMIFSKIEEIKREIMELEEHGISLEKELETFEAERNRLERESVESRNILKEKSAERDIIFRETTRLESLKNQKEKERGEILEQLWSEYEMSLTDAQEFIKEIQISNVSRQLSEVREAIKSLGNVNVNAIEEYKELSARYNFLTAQSEDLTHSVERLESIISDLESQMKSAFAESMKKINQNFKETFVELFGGGTAEIVYSDPNNVLESELEIEVQPPGKNVRHISLLSGGEQAFVSIALYFALLKINPAPFCVLDEIETALDEVNVDRFALYLKKYSQDTQFIVISHRRGTMEAANRLYGVTMQEKGVSKYLSLDINETKKEFERKVNEGVL
jgi:chromosome segregation protein